MRGRSVIILAGLTLARVAFGFQIQTVASLGPALVQGLGIDYARLGTLIGAYMLPGAFVALPLGLVNRRYGDRAVLGSGVALMVAGHGAAILATGPGGLTACRLMAGGGAVALSVLQGKVVADWWEGPRLVIAMGTMVAGFPLGVGLCQILTPSLTGAFGWVSVFLAGSAIAAAALAALLAGLPERAAAGALAAEGVGLPSPTECCLVAVAGAVWTTYNAGYLGLLSYLPSVMQARGASVATISFAMTFATWCNIPAILLGSSLAARFGSARVFHAGMLGLIGAVAAVGAGAPALPASLVSGTIGALQPAVIIAAGTLSARPENRAVGMSIFYTLYYLGGFVIPVVCGMAADRYGGPGAALLTAAALAALSLPLYAWHQRLARRYAASIR